MLRSVDSMSEEDRIHYAYPAEFLQQLNASKLPSALLCLKVGCSVILLRNLDPGEGLCNGTRMVSQTSFSHISNNSHSLNSYKKPSENLSIDTSHVLRQSVLAKILSRSTGNYYVTVY